MKNEENLIIFDTENSSHYANSERFEIFNERARLYAPENV